MDNVKILINQLMLENDLLAIKLERLVNKSASEKNVKQLKKTIKRMLENEAICLKMSELSINILTKEDYYANKLDRDAFTGSQG